MSKKHKSYDIGFKQQLVQEIEFGVITSAEASRVHGLRDEEYLRLKILTCMLKEI